jgi:phosphoinositide-3-kinase regulatory subunit 4
MGFVHGDIKPENILISSFNQVFVSDLSSFKPAYIKSDDLKGYNRHFGELDNNQRCYVAPERFVEVIDESK